VKRIQIRFISLTSEKNFSAKRAHPTRDAVLLKLWQELLGEVCFKLEKRFYIYPGKVVGVLNPIPSVDLRNIGYLNI
jgi:hypothetical protein